MFTTKVKAYDNISLSDIKEDLRIYSGDTTYDAELSRLIKSSVAIAEKTIGSDIVHTVNTLEDYNIGGVYYSIDDINITISAITITNNLSSTPIISTVTGYRTQKYQNTTLIIFNGSISAEKLNIVYTSGKSEDLDPDIIRAITIKVSELLDADKSGYVSNSVKESQAFLRILSPHMILY